MSAHPLTAIDLGRPRRIHIVGVGGAGMSGIAELLVGTGHQVSGSDMADSAILDRLRGRGVRAQVGHHAEHLGDAEIVAISTAIGPDNPEVVAARQAGIAVVRRAEILAAITHTRRTVAVAGTHGKTTTSAMLTVTLQGCGLEPGYLVGGDLHQLGRGAAVGRGEILVVEADESDGTFVELSAAGVIVTNIEPDHLEHYGSFDGLQATFDRFITQCDGPKIVCLDDDGVVAMLARIGGAADPSIMTYGLDPAAHWQIVDPIPNPDGVGFGLRSRLTGEAVAITLGQPGLHNVRNATAAFAMAVALGAEPTAAAEAVSSFAGVARRFERRGEAAGVTVVDDYAHLPTEVAAALAAGRSLAPSRLIAVFQPHRYSRTEQLHATFGDAFVDADRLLITGIYTANEAPRPGITGQLVADAVRRAHPDAAVEYHERLDAVHRRLVELVAPGDLVMTLGAGDLTRLPDRLLASLGAHRWSDAAREARRRLPTARYDASLADWCTYRVGGPAAALVTVDDEAALADLARVVADTGVAVLIVGRGSNLLVADAGFDGLAVLLGTAFSRIELNVDTGVVRAGGSALMPVVARATVRAGLRGFEWAVGVPGSMGGGVCMNAGGHGADMAASLIRVRVADLVTGDVGWRDAASLALGYRSSSLQPSDLVIEVELQLEVPTEDKSKALVESEERLAEIVRWRREHQPGGANAGSVFANPPGDSAGRLIEAAGLKGLRIGSAEVSTKHANFIQADPEGSADDVYALIGVVAERVRDQFGVVLRPENRLIGFDETRETGETA